MATQAALNQKEVTVNKSLDLAIDGNSDVKYPTTKAVKTYVDASATTSAAALNAEIARAITAETANANAIATETTRATTAEATKV